MLKMTNLVGFGGKTIIKTVEEIHFQTLTTVNNNTWTRSSVTFGLPHPERYIIAVIHAYDGAVDDSTVNVAVTIGGVSAYIPAQSFRGYSFTVSGYSGSVTFNLTRGNIVAIAKVPTGETGNVVTTLTNFSGTMDRYSLALYRVLGLSSTTETASTTVAVGNSITMNVPTNGFGIISGVSYEPPFLEFFTNDTNFDYSIANNDAGAVALKTVAGSQTHGARYTSGGTQTSPTESTLHAVTWTFI
jgi:hypothetical protein